MELRDLLIKNTRVMFPLGTFLNDFRNLVEGLRPGTFAAVVPISGVTLDNVVSIVIDQALIEGWIGGIVAALPRNPGTAAELDQIEKMILDSQPRPTTTDPFQEVLLDGDRPFANRTDLRLALRDLCKPTGPPLLLVDGEPLTGKSFSFYLARHIGRQKGFMASQIDVRSLNDAEAVARDILGRLGATLKDQTTGLESGQRSGRDFADQVKNAIEERKQRRLLVFDGFPLPAEAPLSPEIAGFIVRLAKYADEELRPFLRLVLIRFNDTLPDAIDDVAERDQALAFTDADMLAVLKQVAAARGWNVSDAALNAEIAQVSGRSLRERFQLMRKTIKKLSQSPPLVPPGPTPVPPGPAPVPPGPPPVPPGPPPGPGGPP